MQKEFELDFEAHSVSIHISDSTFANLYSLVSKYSLGDSYYFLVDELVYQKYRSVLDKVFDFANVNFLLIPGGTEYKTLEAASTIFADLESRNLPRSIVIVAVGGGVIGDLGGFVASCWYRGVELIHVPTTLLASVDSCIGGKTALNFGNTVNAIGTYHHPSAVLIDTSVLSELPKREIASGFGEIIKYSVLGSTEISHVLETSDEISQQLLLDCIIWSLCFKQKFSGNDVRESSERLYLNFGHTIGHAIEFSTIFNTSGEGIRHGEAVALGMLAAMRISIALGLSKEPALYNLQSTLKKWQLPTQLDIGHSSMSREQVIDSVVSLTLRDKKRNDNGLRLVLIGSDGRPRLHLTSDLGLIRAGVMEIIR